MEKKERKKKPTTVYLIRHGQTTANAAGRIQGKSEQGTLSEVGKTQAEKLRKWAKSEEVSFVYHSPLGRASDTAAMAFPAHERKAERRITEIGMGTLSGMLLAEAIETLEKNGAVSKEEIRRTAKENRFICFHLYAHRFRGESCERAYARGLSFLHEVGKNHPGETVAVVSHGGFNKILLCGLLGMPFSQESFQKIGQSNCAVNKIVISEGKITVESFNLTGHLGGKK
jgi:probable phosphoglycerate mutase